MIFLFSGHDQLVSCSVSSSDPVEELSLDIQEESRGSNPEHFVVQPAVTQLLFDHNQPCSGVLCCPDSSGWLEADPESCLVLVLPDGPAHDQPHGQGGVHPLLPGAGLDEVRPGHHADQRALVDVVHGAQLSYSQDGLHVSRATGLLHGNNLVVKLLPLVLQCELPVDDDVYLGGPSTDGQSDLLQSGAQWELTAGEPGGHRSHGDL